VLLQPWEFGSLPACWIEPLTHEIDEVWVYSHYLHECYLRSSVPAARVHVVPLGVDETRFHPQAVPLPLPTAKRFKFLFVGGTLYRKGIDLLLDAYTQTFTAADDVCLVIKDLGGRSYYHGQTLADLIAHCRAVAGAPAIAYLDHDLSEAELAGLYTACDCLVQPYRGEGFGLPIAEAMASGLAVIVTGHGAALDYCDATNAFLLPATVRYFPEKRVGALETVDYPWLAEPDRAALRHQLRYVVEHPAEARGKGAAASAFIRSQFTWDRTASAVEARLAALRQHPIRRLRRPLG
jgi:glycosyltransferase involved in cell wall biosynthesis